MHFYELTQVRPAYDLSSNNQIDCCVGNFGLLTYEGDSEESHIACKRYNSIPSPFFLKRHHEFIPINIVLFSNGAFMIFSQILFERTEIIFISFHFSPFLFLISYTITLRKSQVCL